MVLAVAVLLVACGSTGSSESNTLTGSVSLKNGRWDPGQACRGADGYGDLTGGARVTVTDGAGELLALGSMELGTASGYLHCDLPFTVPDVPESEFYKVTIGNRPEMSYTLAELEAVDWNLALSLG